MLIVAPTLLTPAIQTEEDSRSPPPPPTAVGKQLSLPRMAGFISTAGACWRGPSVGRVGVWSSLTGGPHNEISHGNGEDRESDRKNRVSKDDYCRRHGRLGCGCHSGTVTGLPSSGQATMGFLKGIESGIRSKGRDASGEGADLTKGLCLAGRR